MTLDNACEGALTLAPNSTERPGIHRACGQHCIARAPNVVQQSARGPGEPPARAPGPQGKAIEASRAEEEARRQAKIMTDIREGVPFYGAEVRIAMLMRTCSSMACRTGTQQPTSKKCHRIRPKGVGNRSAFSRPHTLPTEDTTILISGQKSGIVPFATRKPAVKPPKTPTHPVLPVHTHSN